MLATATATAAASARSWARVALTVLGWRTELPLFLAASRLRAMRVPWGQSWGHSERK